MSESFERWEGRIVDGRFPLQRYLGGSDHSAVFRTQKGAGDSSKAAIKLIPAGVADEKRLLQWEAVGKLMHPNLIGIFGAGGCELDGVAHLYVVEEYAEEDLSQILPERSLTVEEARGMLPPILLALQYVHEHGFVHGRIQPSNILAIGDRVKLSSDTLRIPGEQNRSAGAATAYDPPEAATGAMSPAADVWQLGMTLTEVLTPRIPSLDSQQKKQTALPDGIPQPFREIIEGCLQIDPAKRWTVGQILDRLESDAPGAEQPRSPRVEAARLVPPLIGAEAQSETVASALASSSPHKSSPKWPYALALAAVVALVLFLLARPKSSTAPVEVQSSQVQQGTTEGNAQSAPALTQTAPKPSLAAVSNTKAGATKVGGAEPGAEKEESSANADDSGVVRREIPQVSPSARRTIHGKIKVRVNVEVDAAGNVSAAKLESAGPSKYFSRIALEAARAWKFSPAQAGESATRKWKLQFAFSRARTDVSAAPAKR